MRFFDQYPVFYETTATLLKKNRFEQRRRMIIEASADHLKEARVLDLASHDGRWSFASLKTGATYVEGVEARPALVQHANDTFERYDVPRADYTFHCQDVLTYLLKSDVPRFDVVLCLGFFYHTMHHFMLLERMAATDAPVFIIDTAVLDVPEAIVGLSNEDVHDPRNAVDHAGTGRMMAPVGTPSRAAMKMMLDYLGYDLEEIDWERHVDDFDECYDYKTKRRGTFVAIRREQAHSR